MGESLEPVGFEAAKQLLAAGETLRALALFEREYRADPHNPEYQSYFGVVAALERGQITRSLALCKEALEKEPGRGEFYVNLGKVYLKADDKPSAIRCFREGRAMDPDNAELEKMLNDLGIRATPLFPSLPRCHALNKYLGLVLHRLGFRRPPASNGHGV